METPSSTRRVTRSQTLSVLSNSKNNNSNIPTSRKIEESEKAVSKSRQRNGKQQHDRSALIDITNDSPIVGLATGSLGTPSSNLSKQRSNRAKRTPGSGEALLRGQVKTLLQKVEEEAELSKHSLESRRFLYLQGSLVDSPTIGLLAPTPANTPQVSNLSDDQSSNNNCLDSLSSSPIIEEHLTISQVVNEIFEGKKQESLESQKSLITRSLLFDFSEKSEHSESSDCTSEMTYQGVIKNKTSSDDDDASVWSIQVNASSIQDEDEEEVIEEEEEEEVYCDDDIGEAEEEYEEENDAGGLVDELCEGINKMYIEKFTAKFAGKHIRYVYNSEDDDDEIVEVCGENEDYYLAAAAVSPGIIRLNGLPTPKGKHLRFPEEEEEEEEE